MKFAVAVATALVLMGLCSGVQAQGKVYTWTDARGNVHITDTPPPEQGRVTDVIESPVSGSEPPAQPRPAGRNTLQERTPKVAEAAAQRAREAEQEAQEAVRRADEQRRYAIEYRKRFSNTQERRENFKYKIRAEEEKAEAMRLEALKAVERARAASEEARTAFAPPPEIKP